MLEKILVFGQETKTLFLTVTEREFLFSNQNTKNLLCLLFLHAFSPTGVNQTH